VGLKLNGTNQLLAYTNDVNLLEDDIDTLKKSNETLMQGGWSRSKCRENSVRAAVLSPECRKNHDIRTANRSFEKVAECKYFGITEQIKI
jgi:hypothetical protein